VLRYQRNLLLLPVLAGGFAGESATPLARLRRRVPCLARISCDDRRMYRMRDGSLVQDRRLGRLPQPDDRNARYPIRTLVAGLRQRSYTWKVGVWYDQGFEGACVGYAYSHELAARPYVVPESRITPREFYWDIQRNDPWPGGAYEGADPRYEGTSVLSGAQYFTDHGFYKEYRWAESEADIALAVGYGGPVVIGVNWYEGMMDTNAAGYIRPTGDLMGGHCTLLCGVNIPAGDYLLWNSWGQGWGGNAHWAGKAMPPGTAKLSREHMRRLLAETGEACLPLRRRITA
jgi:hypothetical protein